MGPAILFCPSSSAVHLWVQIVPFKKARHREGSISLPNGFPRCSANTDFTGFSGRRQAFLFNPDTSSENCCKPTYPFEWRGAPAAAAGGEVSVEEAAVARSEAPAEEGLSEPSSSNEKAPVATERKTPSPARRSLNRSNSNANKSVVVSPAELIPGATFPGKVITIQTFGAFVDLGAFTNGLIHISRLSKSYVKKVEDVVRVGQDVNVQVLEFDSQANRISLMLVEEGKAETPRGEEEEEDEERRTQTSSQQQARPSSRRDSSRRPPNSQRKPITTTMKKNEIIGGTVKNIIRSGVFLTLPDGTDGYLPAAEVIFKGSNTNMESQFQVGQEVTVRVLRIEKGRVNLTMRREVNYEKLNEDLNKGVVDGAANPFEIAFRSNELIASFLADRDKKNSQAEVNEKVAEEDEAPSLVEEVKDVASEEDVAEKEMAEEGKDEGISPEAVSSVGEVKKDVMPVVEKPTNEEEKDMAIGVDARKDEGISAEAVNTVGVEDRAEEEKPAEEKEEEAVSGIDAMKEAEKLAAEEEEVAVRSVP